MAGYRWIITYDHFPDPHANPGTLSYAIGIEGPRDADTNIRMTERFRMLDGEDDVVYEGLIGGDFAGHEPLDDFGEPNFGCTVIQYINDDGKWEDL